MSAADFRIAWRGMTRYPGYSGAVILSFAIAVALNTIAFGLVDALFLRPFPIPNQERLVALVSSDKGDSRLLPISYPNFEDLRRASRSLSAISAYQYAEMSLAGDPPRIVHGQIVTGNFFHLLGLQAQLGRTLTPSDDLPSANHPVAVLSDTLWRHRFGGDPNVLGKLVYINKKPFTIVGVCPPGFSGTRRQADAQIWIPLSASSAVFSAIDRLHNRDWRLLRVLGLLAPKFTLSEAKAEIRSLGRRLEHDHPGVNQGQSLLVIPFAKEAIGPNSHAYLLRTSAILLALALLALLGAGINSANFLLMSLAARSDEMGVRLALGATIGRIIRQCTVESMALTGLSLSLGLLLSALGGRFLQASQTPLFAPGALNLALSWRSVAWIVTTTLAVGIVGVIPASRMALGHSLLAAANGNKHLNASPGRRLFRSFFVSLQVAFITVFIACASWLAGSILRIREAGLGFAPEDLYLISLNLKNAGYGEEEGKTLCAQALTAIASLPGVGSVGLADQKMFFGAPLLREVSPVGPEKTTLLVPLKNVTEGYFHTVRLPLLRGRPFRSNEGGTTAIVNSELATRLWPGLDALGQQFRFDNEEVPITIIGIVATSREISLTEPATPLVYLPFHQHYSPTVTFHVRSSLDSKDLFTAVRLTLSHLDDQIPFEITDPDSLIQTALWAPLLAKRLLIFLGTVTLLIFTVGSYILTDLHVRTRRRELALRMALGAKPASLMRLLCRDCLLSLALGFVAGSLTALGIARLLSYLTGLLEPDLLVLAGIFTLLSGLSLTATLLPLLRIVRSSLHSSLAYP